MSCYTAYTYLFQKVILIILYQYLSFHASPSRADPAMLRGFIDDRNDVRRGISAEIADETKTAVRKTISTAVFR